MAIVQAEPQAEACAAVLAEQDRLIISAGTLAETLIVARRRNRGEEMEALVSGLNFEVVDVTPASARRIAEAYDRFGKGEHAAALNFGDCFAYEVAATLSAPLLFVGDDFTKTDLAAAL